MKENKSFTRQRKPSPEAIDALLDMYKKCSEVKTLIKTFDLDIRTAQIDNEPFKEKTLSIAAFNAMQKLNNTNNMKEVKDPQETSKFKNEVEETPQRGFIKFESEGDVIEGVYSGESQQIKNGDDVNTCHVIKVGDDEKLLPSNVILNRKLENLKKIVGDKIKKGVEVQITYVGMIKKDGVANKMKDFKLLTA